MRKIKNPLISLLFILPIVIISCSSPKPQEIAIDNKYKITIPGYMSKTNTLNDEASLQYQHTIKELYIIAFDSDINNLHEALEDNGLTDLYDTSFNGFCNLMSNSETDAFTVISDRDKFKDETINGLITKTFENTRILAGINVYYKVALIEGKNNYYQVIAWTLADRKNKYKQTIDDMIYSFSEL